MTGVPPEGGSDFGAARLAPPGERPRSGSRPPGRAGARRLRVTESISCMPRDGVAGQARPVRRGGELEPSVRAAPAERKPPTEGAGGTFRERFPVVRAL